MVKAVTNFFILVFALSFFTPYSFSMEVEAVSTPVQAQERALGKRDRNAEFLLFVDLEDPYQQLHNYTLEDVIALSAAGRPYTDSRAQQRLFLLRLELVSQLRNPKNRALAVHDRAFLQKRALDAQARAEIAPLLLSKELCNFLASSSFRPLIIPEIVTHPLLEAVTVIECQSFPRYVRFINPGESCLALVEYAVLSKEGEIAPVQRSFYEVSLYTIRSGKREALLTGLQEGEVKSCVLSKSMTVFAVATHERTWVWDMVSRKILSSFVNPIMGFTEIVLSPDGKYLIAIGESMLIVYESATGQLLHHCAIDNGERVKGLSKPVLKCAPHGSKVVVGTDKGTLYQWDLSTGKLDFKMQVHTDIITTLHVGNDFIKSCGGDWKMKSVNAGRVVASLVGKDAIKDVQLTHKLGAAFSNNGDLLLLSHPHQPGGTLFTISSNKSFHIPLKGELKICSFSPHDTFFATASDTEIVVAPLKREQATFLTCSSKPLFISFSESSQAGTTVLTGFAKEVRFWPLFETEFKEKMEKLTVEQLLLLDSVYEAYKKNQEYVLIEPSNAFMIVQSLPAEIKHAVMSVSRTVKVPRVDAHDHVKLVRTGSVQNLIQNPFSYVSYAGDLTPPVFGAVMKVIALEVTNGLPEWIQPRLEKTIHQLRGHDQAVTCLAYDGMGKKIASGACDGSIMLWDLETGACCRTIAAHDGIVFPLSFNAAGTHLVSSSSDGICVWHVATGERVEHYPVTDSASLVFDRTGEFVLAGSYNGRISILHAGAIVERFVAHKEAIWALNVDAFGNRIVSCDNTGSLKIWQCQKPGVWKQPLLKYEGVLKKRMWHIAFDVDNASDCVIFAHHDEGIDAIDSVEDTYSRMDSPMVLLSPWLIVASKPESRCIWLGADNTIVVSELKNMRTWVEAKAGGPCTIL